MEVKERIETRHLTMEFFESMTREPEARLEFESGIEGIQSGGLYECSDHPGKRFMVESVWSVKGGRYRFVARML